MYHKFESSDGVPSYSKICKYENKEAMFTIARLASDSGTKRWCITATVPPNRQLAFYVAYAPSFVAVPPKKNWMIVQHDEKFLSSNYEARGLDQVPVITHEYDEKNQSKGIVGMQVEDKSSSNTISYSSSTRRSRATVRSTSTPRPTRNVTRSISNGRFRRRDRA